MITRFYGNQYYTVLLMETDYLNRIIVLATKDILDRSLNLQVNLVPLFEIKTPPGNTDKIFNKMVRKYGRQRRS